MKRALLVIDVQNEYFSGGLPVTYPQGSINNIFKVIEAAKQNGVLVIAIQHTAPQADSKTFVKGSLGWELHEGIKNIGYDYLIEKNLPGSFTGTNLEAILKENKIDTVVISGYMTQMCCDTTARQALHLGLSVEFLSDSTGTLDITNYAGKVTAEELHRCILVTQAMKFSKVISTDNWIKLL
ncbi:MAG: cysteine hydrolase [Clostridiaceae bacterium]|nr:cysteine hydrolase [Clostridiaceae bacterium]